MDYEGREHTGLLRHLILALGHNCRNPGTG
jgi:hypothetical protein